MRYCLSLYFFLFLKTLSLSLVHHLISHNSNLQTEMKMKPKRLSSQIATNHKLSARISSVAVAAAAAAGEPQRRQRSSRLRKPEVIVKSTTTTTISMNEFEQEKQIEQMNELAESAKISSSSSKRGETKNYTCHGCNQQIRDKFLLRSCNKFWHNSCLKCDRCHAQLGELGPSFYERANMNLCRQDYFEMFGHKAICAVCDKLIFASEMVMRAKQNVYHLECFACQLCSLRFCVGDRFHLCENKIVCQFDYDEHILPIQESMRMLSAANNQPLTTGHQYDISTMSTSYHQHQDELTHQICAPTATGAQQQIESELPPEVAQCQLITSPTKQEPEHEAQLLCHVGVQAASSSSLSPPPPRQIDDETKPEVASQAVATSGMSVTNTSTSQEGDQVGVEAMAAVVKSQEDEGDEEEEITL